jgi:hypothetical protein
LLGQVGFKTLDDPRHYQVDFVSGNVWQENQLGEMLLLGNLQMEGVSGHDIPNNPKLNAFRFNNSILITPQGTGQVYLLDINRKILKRLDHTFFRGYNFHAVQFLKNDTLFSVGGMGFWQTNNILTYFSTKSNEWELYDEPTNDDPKHISASLGGYDSYRQVLCVAEFPLMYEKQFETDHYRFFERKIGNGTWQYKGDIQVELLRKLGIEKLESISLENVYLFLYGNQFIWADVRENAIYQPNVQIPMFNLYYDFSYKNGYIYSSHKIYKPILGKDVIILDSISVEKLKSMSTYKGPFYIEPYPIDLLGYSAAAILLLTAGGIYAYRKSKSKKAHESSIEPLDGLPAGASAFLNACLHYPKGHAFSSQHFTEMMGYGSYAYETQRQVRAKLIKGINSYFWAHYRMDDVIVRQTANDDKRFSVYLIAEVHYDTLKKLLQV